MLWLALHFSVLVFMSVTVSKKLSGSIEGALAGGGDPATSPLYVFGPFLKLIVLAGVAKVTFGVTLWLAVFSVVMVSTMYRQVMGWVTDGSGGSGLSEEEFGSWAVKINGGITIIEYILTYLVSMAALVTFAADRFSTLNAHILGTDYRAILAVILSFFIAWVVNLGPRIAARAFGPATGAVLLFLWLMIGATIYQTGFHLPDFNLQAFSFEPVVYQTHEGGEEKSSFIHLTFGGYARILALMTGIEIFANLVAAYAGTRAEKSRKAFGSLVIIMGTTVATMLIVGPAILAHSNPFDEHVSVFTQTMDYLLPPGISYFGTLIGIAVLLSACAAAAQGIQNLALGLRYRHYVPAKLGQRNKHDVADLPVWLMIILSSVCFLLIGTHEETYLALYAAGVFILLSMTGWAASKRLTRGLKETFSRKTLFLLIGTIIAATLTSFATIIIFEERFFEGAWCYLIIVPMSYMIFSHYREQLGAPSSVEDRLGLAVSGQGYVPQMVYTHTDEPVASFRKMLVALNGTAASEQVLPMVGFLARTYGAQFELLLVNGNPALTKMEQLEYLSTLADFVRAGPEPVAYKLSQSDNPNVIDRRAMAIEADLIVMTVADASPVGKLFSGGATNQVIKKTMTPTLLVRAGNHWRSRYSQFKQILVALDGSQEAEYVLPYLRVFTQKFNSEVVLLSVPEGSESEEYGQTAERYLNDIVTALQNEGIAARALFVGSGPSRTILAVAEEEQADLIMMTSHGRGGTGRNIHLGSVTEKVVQDAHCPVFVVPLTRA